MKLCTFAIDTPLGRQRRVGIVADALVIDATAARESLLERRLPAAAAERVALAQVPPDLAAIIGAGSLGLEWVAEAAVHAAESGAEATAGGKRIRHQLQDLTLLAPIPQPPGIACFATWKAHIEDSASKGFALKFPEADSEIRPYYKGNADSVAGPGAPLQLPSYAQELDVECELAAVVGGGGKDLNLDQARAAIAGYCIFNDVSVRDIQVREMQTGLGPTKGKDQDGGNVFGPWLVTADEVGDPRALAMALHVNGETWSDHESRHMAWDFADLLSYLSRGQTVRPGHILTSGCFPGGSALDLGRKLRPGDLVELRISKLGSLVNRIAPAA